MNNSDIKNFYNTTIKASYGDLYEQKRWFSTPERFSGFKQTNRTIQCIKKVFLTPPVEGSYLELGPGAGTWTNLFLNMQKVRDMDLVDISSEMLSISKNRFKDVSGISFFLTDFLEFESDKKYNLFFSSRVVEYIYDKKVFCKKLYSLMDHKSIGIVITKMPHRRRNIFTKRASGVHGGQIAPREFKKVIEVEGFRVCEIKPTTFVFPVLHNGFLNNCLYAILSKLPLNPISNFFLESYTIVFKKI